MSEKKTHASETAEQVARTAFTQWTAESQRFIDEMQRANERMLHETERLMHEQQKFFESGMKMSRAMSAAMLESARRMTGVMGA